MIVIHRLHKQYGLKTVLQDINLQFEAGRVYGIVGENGAGKTTLFRCMAGLEAYEGSIETDLSPLKDHLGLLLTEPFFLDKITGYEYLRLLCNARKKTPGDLDHKNIFDLPLGDYASTYSTGMKKKLALMAIMLQDNNYFILDEPFNGVDIQSNILITDIIHRLRAMGKTVLISSHIFSTLHDTCDEISVLQKGRLIQTVQKTDFETLEREMRAFIVGDKVDRLL
jgi:ABC-2 type transport system ATP-binding protein